MVLSVIPREWDEAQGRGQARGQAAFPEDFYCIMGPYRLSGMQGAWDGLAIRERIGQGEGG